MKILLDTNVLISALVFGGQAGNLLNMLFSTDHELYVSDYIDQEFKEKLELKWPSKAQVVYKIISSIRYQFLRKHRSIIR